MILEIKTRPAICTCGCKGIVWMSSRWWCLACLPELVWEKVSEDTRDEMMEDRASVYGSGFEKYMKEKS